MIIRVIRIVTISSDLQILLMTLVRSVLIAGASVFFSGCVFGVLGGLKSPLRRGMLLGMIFLPLLMPDIFLGYAYKSMSDQTVRDLGLREFVYGMLLLGRYGGLGVVVHMMMPGSDVTRSSVHLHDVGGGGLMGRIKLRLQSRMGGDVLVFALVLLMCFHESQVGSLLIVEGYSRLIFERVQDADHLSSWGLIMAVLLPGILFLGLLGAVLKVTVFGAGSRRGLGDEVVGVHGMKQVIGVVFVIYCLMVTVIYPVYEVSSYLDFESMESLRVEMLGLKEIGTSGVLALISSLLAMLVVYILLPSGEGKIGLGYLPTMILVVPGVLGVLVVSLFVQWGINLSWLRGLRETALPLIFVQTLMLLPFALLFKLVVGRRASSSACLLGEMMMKGDEGKVKGGELIWRYRYRPMLYNLVVLFYFSYFEITAGSILMPADLQLAAVILYQRMHYNQSAMLSLELYVVLLLPLMIFGLLLVLPWGRLVARFYRG